MPKPCKTCYFWKQADKHNCLIELKRLVQDMKEGFEAIQKTDKTPVYRYRQYRPDITAPPNGSRWLTPMEIAEEQLKRWKEVA